MQESEHFDLSKHVGEEDLLKEMRFAAQLLQRVGEKWRSAFVFSLHANAEV